MEEMQVPKQVVPSYGRTYTYN